MRCFALRCIVLLHFVQIVFKEKFENFSLPKEGSPGVTSRSSTNDGVREGKKGKPKNMFTPPPTHLPPSTRLVLDSEQASKESEGLRMFLVVEDPTKTKG